MLCLSPCEVCKMNRNFENHKRHDDDDDDCGVLIRVSTFVLFTLTPYVVAVLFQGA